MRKHNSRQPEYLLNDDQLTSRVVDLLIALEEMDADAVRALKREWLDLLESELTAAGATDPPRDAFCIDAYLCAANTRRELFGADAELDRAHTLALDIIG